MSLTISPSSLGSYDSLKVKVSSIDEGDFTRLGKVISYYCVLAKLHTVLYCPVNKERGRCPLFEAKGPGRAVPTDAGPTFKSCKCIVRKDDYACAAYLRFSNIYFDVMEDLACGD